MTLTYIFHSGFVLETDIQNIVVGGIIADVAPSYRNEVGRLCLQCGSDKIRIWDMKTCPKCASKREQSDA